MKISLQQLSWQKVVVSTVQCVYCKYVDRIGSSHLFTDPDILQGSLCYCGSFLLKWLLNVTGVLIEKSQDIVSFLIYCIANLSHNLFGLGRLYAPFSLSQIGRRQRLAVIPTNNWLGLPLTPTNVVRPHAIVVIW